MCHDTTASPSWRIRFLCSDLRSFSSSYSNVAVRWVPRICNEAAHILAKWSLLCNFYGSFEVSFSPNSFSFAMLRESSGLLQFVSFLIKVSNYQKKKKKHWKYISVYKTLGLWSQCRHLRHQAHCFIFN